jgi:hypothetical protein
VFAYLDAGSASVVASAVAAGVGGAAVAFRGALGKFKRTKKSELTDAVAEPADAPDASASSDA